LSSECRRWARERADELNLPIIEIPGVNPNLKGLGFEASGIYFVEFDALGETRAFRHW
jgi:hypothetical protein